MASICLALSICANRLRVHYFDRSGLIVSFPFHINRDPGPIRFTEILGTLNLSESDHLGLDPTIHMCNAACICHHANLALGAKGRVEDNNNIIVQLITRFTPLYPSAYVYSVTK